MASFHLNENACFDRTGKKKRTNQTTCHLELFIFFIIGFAQKLLGWPLFQSIQCFISPPSLKNLHANDNLTSDYTLILSFMADWHHSGLGAAQKFPTQPTLMQQLFQVIMAILRQRLGSFRDKSRAKIWHH